MIFEPLIVLAMLWLSVAVLFGLLPWMGQLLAIYAIHGLRDRMFEIFQTFPGARRSLFYRDADALLALTLHVVREHSYRDCAALLRKDAPGRKPTWRAARYEHEMSTIYNDPAGRAVFSDLIGIVTRSEHFVILRMVTGHPGLLLLVMVALPILVARSAWDTTSTQSKRINDIDSAIDRLGDDPSSSGFEAVRRLFGGPTLGAAA